MATANLPANRQPSALDPSTLEKVLLSGDLANLSPTERLSYYQARCHAIGLDPLSQPFAYITLNGKLTLYAQKGCTDQLRRIHGVSVTGLRPQQVADTYVVVCDVRDKNGRTDSATGAVHTAGLRGEALSNALMKAETKSKRRATLSLCGLGMLDESEIDSIPNAQPAEPANTPQPVAPERTAPQGQDPRTETKPKQKPQRDTKSKQETWAKWIVAELGKRNAEFANDQAIAGIDKAKRKREVMNQFEAANLVASECIHQDMVSLRDLAKADNPNKRDSSKVAEFVATVFAQWPDWTKQLVTDRYREKKDELARTLGLYNPDAEPVNEDDEDVDVPY